MNSDLKTKIEDFWEIKETENFTNKVTKGFIFEVLNLLDTGQERIAEKKDGNSEKDGFGSKSYLIKTSHDFLRTKFSTNLNSHHLLKFVLVRVY